MMNLMNYVENHGKKNITIFILIDLKKRDQGKYCICNESKKNIYRGNTSDETFLNIIQNCNLLSKLLNVIFD